MITLLAVFALVVTVVVAVVVPVRLPRLSARVYLGICWIPTAALGLEWVFADALMRTLSYAVVLVPLLTCLASLLVATIGVTLALRTSRGQRTGLTSAVLLASVPGLLLIAWVTSSLIFRTG